MTTNPEGLHEVARQLRAAGATLPAPQAGGAIESAMTHGLCIALALVEQQIAALAAPVGGTGEAVAWAVQLQDGTIGKLGWRPMQEFKPVSEFASLGEGCRYVFAHWPTPPAAAAGREWDDAARLEWIDAEARKPGGLLLHAEVNTGRRGIGVSRARPLRDAIDGCVPPELRADFLAARASTPEGDGPDGEDGPWAEGWAQRSTPEADR